VHHETTNPTPSFVFINLLFPFSQSLFSSLALRLARPRGSAQRAVLVHIISSNQSFLHSSSPSLSISPFFLSTPMVCGVYCAGRCQVRLGKVRGKMASLAGVKLVGGFDCIHSFWLLGYFRCCLYPVHTKCSLGFLFSLFSLGKHRLSTRFNVVVLCVCCVD